MSLTSDQHQDRGPIAAVLPLSAAVLLSSLGTSIANVALPTLARSFHAPFQDVQWVSLAYLLAMTMLIVGAGRLGDMFGRRRLLLAGLVVFTTASTLAAFALILPALIAARALQGVGAALMMALSMALVSESVPNARTGSAMGLLGTMSAIGTALGPSLGGALIELFGWRALFWINIPAGILAFVLVLKYVPHPKSSAPTARQAFDVPATLLLALVLGAYALAMTVGRGQFGPVNLALLVSAAVGAGLFIRIEIRSTAPLIPISLLKNTALTFGLLTNAVVSTVLMATLVVGPFYLAGALGLNAALVGLVMSVGPILSAVTGLPAGRLVDRVGAGRMAIFGLAGILSGCILLVILPAGLGIAGYVAPISLITISYALFQAANNTAIMKGVASESRGVMSGLLNLSRNLGLITGVSVMGAVFALGAGASDISAAGSAAVANGMRTTFIASALLIVVALLAAGGTVKSAVLTISKKT